ncbi:MAG: radical SAM protein [bacterium]
MNDLRLAQRAFRAGRAKPEFPYKLTFAVTERCNLRCGMCRIWESGGAEMPLPEVLEFFSRSGRFSWIDVTGGEIFLREDIIDVFRVILDQCRDLALLHFPTNGYLVDRIVDVTRELIRRKAPRLMITVSIDGPPEIHDAMRGREGSFDRAVETYARLRELPGCKPVLGMTLSGENMRAAEETLAAVRRRVPRVAADDLHVNLPNRSGHYYHNESDPHPAPEAMASALRGIRKRRGIPSNPSDVVERRLLSLGERYLRTGACPISCKALSASCFVNASGVVFPCVTWGRPIGALGDFGHDLEALWNSVAAVAAREEIAAGRCPQCWTACEAVPSLAARWGTLRL